LRIIDTPKFVTFVYCLVVGVHRSLLLPNNRLIFWTAIVGATMVISYLIIVGGTDRAVSALPEQTPSH
jgi:hypothetical protein